MDNIVGHIKAINPLKSTINRTNTIKSTTNDTNTFKGTTNETNTLKSTINETNTIKSTINYPGAGDSAYQVAVKNGFIGTEQEWLASLKGDTGQQGLQGIKGEQGDSYVLTNEDRQEIADIVKTDMSGTIIEETDPTVPQHVKDITIQDIQNWNNPDIPEVDNNYNNATNKPSINGIELSGNKTTEELGIEIPTKTSELENDSGFLEHKGIFYDWFEFDAYEFKEGEMFLFNLSGALASYGGTCIGQYSQYKIGDTYIYKYIRCFNITTLQSLMLDILYRKINVNQMNIQDTNDYFVADGLDDILQEIGGQFKNGFEGKILSILGDSISTFEGYVPTSDGYNLEHRTTYPSSNLLTDVEDTWWHRLINNLGMKLGVNDSWSGTRVSNSSTTDTGSVGAKTHIASMTRISNLGANGNPDLILFFGGTNDIRGNVTLGSFDSTATHTSIDLTSETYPDFATAYKIAIQRLIYMYPKAKIVVILPMVATRDYTIGSLDNYIEIIKNICDYFGVYCIDLRRCGINYFNANKYLPDGLHPNANGMELMERHIRQQLLSLYSLEIGEATTYNVTNNLSNVVSDKIYVKAVRSGETYTATIIAKTPYYLDTVNVTMDKKDITATAYSNGVINIQEVTGDIVISATAKERTSTNSHAKTIPLTATADTNLAEEIGLLNEYYYNKKWRTALTNGTLVYSLTIPVIEGDKIYSLSFEASDKNGTSEIGRTDNGARITYFNNETAVSGKTPAETYSEFSENGYITVPSGVNAINISTWLPDNQVIKLLTL